VALGKGSIRGNAVERSIPGGLEVESHSTVQVPSRVVDHPRGRGFQVLSRLANRETVQGRRVADVDAIDRPVALADERVVAAPRHRRSEYDLAALVALAQ
jgi:hypothetical protein